jgi:hypothetical protein
MKDYFYIIFGLLAFISIICYEVHQCHNKGMSYNFGESRCEKR